MKKIIFFTFSILIAQLVYAQNISKANVLYEKRAYAEATELFLKEKNKTQEVLEKLGDCYYFNSRMKEASNWYGQLVEKYKNSLQPIYLFRYFQTLKGIENYSEADHWQQLYNEVRTSKKVTQRNTSQFIDSLKIHTDHTFELINAPFNSANSDFGAILYNNKIVFSSNRTLGEKYQWNNLPYLDIYETNLAEQNVVTSLPSEINTNLHESNAVFSKDGGTVYFTRNTINDSKEKNAVSHLKIYKSTLVNNTWTTAVQLPFNVDNYSFEHPALNANETKLYFSSDMPGSFGSFDLFVVDLHPDGTFGTPTNLGSVINTEHREQFPFIINNALYFASDGHFGMGGLDIFKSSFINNSFSTPQNLGKPINSCADDFGYFYSNSNEIGFISSNRIGGKGDDDIYKIVKKHTYFVNGLVQNKEDLSLLPHSTVTLLNDNNEQINTMTVGTDAAYIFPIEINKSYKLKATQKLFNPSVVEFASDNNGNINKNILLHLDSYTAIDKNVVVENGKTQIKINPIYFDFDKWDIRLDAALELNNVVAILKKYPEMAIEVGAHTDSRGLDDYNMILSEKRAQSVKEYLIKNGASTSKVTFKGYGESQLLNNCSNNVLCPKKDHDINRRCEFVLLN